MPFSSGGSGVAGDSARLFAWQMDHYIVRGGPNDPVLQTNIPPTAGGSFSYNTVFTLNPVAGQQPPTPRTMSLNSGGTLAAGILTGTGQGTGATAAGGLYMGTLPQGAWIQGIELFCYAALTVGTATSVGIFYVPVTVDLTYPPLSMNLLAYITTPAAGTLYGVKSGSGITAFTAVVGAGGTAGAGPASPLGPGAAPAAPGITQLASLGDIDIYVATFLPATGSGTANSTGSFALMINFTGLEG